jgi:hypothetical protein
MCFLDLSGYTRLTKERGDEAAAAMAASLADWSNGVRLTMQAAPSSGWGMG